MVDQAVAFAVQYFCGQSKAGAYELTIHEAVDAVLAGGWAGDVYAGMKHGPRYHLKEFFRLARGARDPAAMALVRLRFAELGWAEVVLALDGADFVDQLVECARARRTFNDSAPPLVAGYFGGMRVKPVLRELFDQSPAFRPDRYALGIAIIGDPADLAWFKQMSAAGEGATAKRIHSALAKDKLKDRLTAVDALTKNVDSVAPLVALCKLLSDDHAEIVEHAACHLRNYAVPRADASDAFHAIFLARARAAIERGVTPTARGALDELVAIIPRSEPFPIGPPREAIAPRKQKPALIGAKARGLEMLETLRDQVPLEPATQRDAALEAEIAADPDDVARYLVYADWLQAHDDARGYLISLQHAMHAQPGDKARAVAAQGFLDRHRYALLGRLEPFVRERDMATAELEWFMGFIRKARIASPSAKLITDALGYLLESPSAAFLQELVVDSDGGPLPIDPQRVVDMLLAAKQPQTLHLITVGKPGSWTVPPELAAAFPQLARDPRIAWQEAIAKVDEQRRLKLDVELLNVPAPKPRFPVEVDLETIMIGLKAELDKERPLGLLAAMPQVFEAESLDAFAAALARRWELQSQSPRWVFDVLGPLGGDQCALWLGERLQGFSHARALQAIEHLSRIGSDGALYELIALLFSPGGLGARRYAALGALDVLAKRRGLADRDALMTAIGPVADDARTLVIQTAWLEHVMLSGYRIPPELFERHVVQNRIRAGLAAQLLWAECEGERIVRLFRLDDAFRAGGHAIGLVHPAELSPEELERARRDLPAQPLVQLARPVFAMSSDEARANGLAKFARRRVGFYPIQGVLQQCGWSALGDGDAGMTEGWMKWFARDDARAHALLGETGGAIAEVTVRGRDNVQRRFNTLHVVTISELLWDLEAAHGWTPSETTATPVFVVERAKSGRSKCVVCGEPIEKDALRIGIERLIETPAFTGRGTVWLHPACAGQAPELAGVDVARLVAERS